MKFVDIIGSAIANTFRSKLRTTLTVIAIFIGAFTLTITTAIGTGVTTYINTQTAAIGASDQLTITKAEAAAPTGGGPSPYDPKAATATSVVGGGGRPGITIAALTKDDLTKIAAIPGISDVVPGVRVAPDFIQYSTAGKFQLSVNPINVVKADLAAGGQLDTKGSTNEVLVPTTYVTSLGLGSDSAAVGKTVTIGITDYAAVQHEVRAKIVGVQNATLLGGGVGLNQHLTDDLVALQATGKPTATATTYAGATAHIDGSSSTSQVDRIKSDLTAAGYSGVTVADQIGSFETVINGIIGVLDAFAVIALLAAAFGIINTLLMSVQERTREIGLMKAMGMSGGKVYALFSTEAVVIGFLGSAIGAGVAIVIGSILSGILGRTALSGLPGLNILQFSPASVIVIILAVMLIAFLAGTLPARRAARQSPIDALRYE